MYRYPLSHSAHTSHNGVAIIERDNLTLELCNSAAPVRSGVSQSPAVLPYKPCLEVCTTPLRTLVRKKSMLRVIMLLYERFLLRLCYLPACCNVEFMVRRSVVYNTRPLISAPTSLSIASLDCLRVHVRTTADCGRSYQMPGMSTYGT